MEVTQSWSLFTTPWNAPGQNTGAGTLSLPNQRSNPGLPHCRQIPYQLSHLSPLHIKPMPHLYYPLNHYPLC